MESYIVLADFIYFKLYQMIEDLNLPDKSVLMKEILDYRNNTLDIDYLLEKQRFLQEQVKLVMDYNHYNFAQIIVILCQLNNIYKARV